MCWRQSFNRHWLMNHLYPEKGAVMDRRTFLKTLAAASGVMFLGKLPIAHAALPKAKITKVRILRPPNLNMHFNQSNMVVIIETVQQGLFGVGEGGSVD